MKITEKDIDEMAYFIGKSVQASAKKNIVDAVRIALTEYLECKKATSQPEIMYTDEQPSDYGC
jgi:hypothetical protein